jgi:DNA-binding MarR family transcriptional regulator
VLFRCVESRKMTHGELALRIGRDGGKVTRFLRRLEGKQLITQGSDRNDRRLTVIKPTRTGEKLAADLTCVFDSVRKRLFVGIRDGDVRETEQILRQLYKNAVRAGFQREKIFLRRRKIANQNAKPRGLESNEVDAATDGTKSTRKGLGTKATGHEREFARSEPVVGEQSVKRKYQRGTGY